MLHMNSKMRVPVISLGMAIAASGCNKDEPRDYNFIVILADDISAVDFGCYGGTEYNTPNIDRLAERGVKFNVAWSTPLSMPSRIQLMTGRYATSTGWYGNDFKPLGNDKFDVKGDPGYELTDELFFSKLFQENGYKTAISGKWHVEDTPDWNRFNNEYGFDEYCLWGLPDSLPPGYEDYGKVEDASGPFWDIGGRGPFWQPAIITNGQLGPTGENVYGPDVFTSFVTRFIRENKQSKFLVYYPMTLAHSWWYAPVSEKTRWGTFGPVPELDSLGNKTGKKTPVGHKFAVEYMDHLVGKIINELDSLDLTENTVIVFTTDNGSPGKGKGHLQSENGIRVPLIVSCPGYIPQGKSTSSFTQLADVFPSIVDIADLTVPDSVKLDGISFLPAVEKDSLVRHWLYSYLNYKHAFRYKDYYLDADDSLWYCDLQTDGDIIYSHVPDTSRKAAVVEARKEFKRLNQLYPGADTINNPKYERLKKVQDHFTNMINDITSSNSH